MQFYLHNVGIVYLGWHEHPIPRCHGGAPFPDTSSWELYPKYGKIHVPTQVAVLFPMV